MTEWWEELRAHFPLCERRAYFFAGAQAPLAIEVRAAIDAFLDLWEEKVWRYEPLEWRRFDESQKLLGAILGCDPLEIVTVESTSHAMSLAATMVLDRWRARGKPPANIVLHDEVHGASAYAWVNASRREALELRWPVPDAGEDPVEVVARSVDENTIAVVVNHVSNLTGRRLDVVSLARRFSNRDWALLVDAAQSAGAIPLKEEVRLCDFVGMPGYKWLFGPPGTGYLAAKRAWLDGVGPSFAGWASARDVSVTDPHRLELGPGSIAFRLGMPNFLCFAGAAEALRISYEAGHERIGQRIRNLTDRFLSGMTRNGLSSPTPVDWAGRAGVIALDLPNAVGVMESLLRENIEVGVEEGRLRVDIHAYNTEQEVDELLGHLPAVRGVAL